MTVGGGCNVIVVLGSRRCANSFIPLMFSCLALWTGFEPASSCDTPERALGEVLCP